jgi:site-specific recombinase XerD
MTPGELRERLKDYLELRRALGIPLHGNANVLADFVGYVDEHCDSQPVVTRLTMDWLDRYATEHKSKTPSAQLSLVRQFLMYVSSAVPGTEVPDIGLIAGYRRSKPFVFAPAECEAILEATDFVGTTGSFLRVTFKAILGLMMCTGLRVAEAIDLNRDHVMPRSNPRDLIVLEGKFGKSRLVPLHPTTAKQMSIYAGHRELLGYSRLTPAFFVSDYGRRLSHSELADTFRGIVDQLGLKARNGSANPKLRSLRHTFAITRLRRWHEENIDAKARLAHLATYLGHVDVRETYWYLSATPELLTAAGKRFDGADSNGGSL